VNGSVVGGIKAGLKHDLKNWCRRFAVRRMRPAIPAIRNVGTMHLLARTMLTLLGLVMANAVMPVYWNLFSASR